MSKKYKLSYTAVEIDKKLGAINQLSRDVNRLSTDAEQVSTEVEQLSTDIEQILTDVNASKNHANQHSSAGLDPIKPEDIGAMPDVPVTDLDEGKFLCVVNGDWAAVNATIGDDTSGISTAEKAERDGAGNIIVNTYETKNDANTKLADAKSYTDDKLAEAKSYTDDALENSTLSDNILSEANTYTDNKLTEANTYTDNKLTEAKSYTDDAIESAFANVLIAEQMSF